ncbi:liver-expressed antimicrobial peptide 2-like isoform X2 [Salvelinus fontinalis]|uniref:liver-expressed antimicrobial peptide 2-like isoform X2 n=1 Tax=Salvelinus fontinalis TaxID=8038 RepID=UPI002485D051|nr:liver-expressed antimicrobial peptide 2-like isoform X2 [Salvelinus fontinalis]
MELWTCSHSDVENGNSQHDDISTVSSSPDPSADVQPNSGQLQLGPGQRVLRRTARMTPLWRTMGTKPYGAYCQNYYECSTGICRRGHCMFSQAIKS